MNADHRLLERAFTESQRLAADANIAAVGYGTKLRDGRPSGGTCLQYFVRRKLPPGELERATTWPVPAAVDGLPTDVVEVGELRAAISNVAPPMGTRGTRMGDPLIGGYASVGLGDSAGSAGGFGTLGGLCFDSSTGAPLALSAAHTWGTTGKPEVMQPLLPRTLFGTNAEPLTNPSGLVRADVPIGLRAAVAFANAGVWARFVTGLGDDPVVFGQTSTPVAANARTDAETVSIAAEASPGLPPAGRTFTESIAWSYQRLSASALDAAVNQDRTNDKILSVRRASTDLASYTTSKAVKITAEIFWASGCGRFRGQSLRRRSHLLGPDG